MLCVITILNCLCIVIKVHIFVHIVKTIASHVVCHCMVCFSVHVTNTTHIDAFAPYILTKCLYIVPLRSHSFWSYYQLVLHILLFVPLCASEFTGEIHMEAPTHGNHHLRTASSVLYQCQTLHDATLHADLLKYQLPNCGICLLWNLFVVFLYYFFISCL